MRTTESFGIHFILRINKAKNGNAPVYARISVNGQRIEMSLKKSIKISDWNNSKGLARPKNDSLKVLNNYLEHVRSLLSSHYQEFVVNKELVTAEAIKNKFLGIEQQENTLQSLVDYHNLHMKGILELYKLSLAQVDESKRLQDAIGLCKKALAILKKYLGGYFFESLEDEIEFFKYIKPQFIASTFTTLVSIISILKSPLAVMKS